MTGDELLDRLDYGLLKTGKDFPEARMFIWSLHKHIKFAMEHPEQRKLSKLIPKSRDWLRTMSWKHPQFRDHFQPMVDLINDFENQ